MMQPEQPPFVAWRRPLGSTGLFNGPWEMLPATQADQKGKVYQAIMDLQMQDVSETGFEYAIVSVGQRPAWDTDVPGTYRTREMRPKR